MARSRPAPSRVLVAPLSVDRRSLPLLAFRLVAVVSALLWTPHQACAAPPTPQTSQSAPLLPWLAPATSRPLQLVISHDVEYEPVSRSVRVIRSDWDLRRLVLNLFDGQSHLEARGDIASGRPSDVATTITLHRIDVQELLRFLTIPRAAEVEARLSGWVAVRIHEGEWARLEVHLRTEPQSVRLSRALIKELLGARLTDDGLGQKVDAALDHYFGAARMIPIDSMSIDGELGRQRMSLRIPLRNAALNIDFEPKIDRASLWELWKLLKKAGLRDVKGVDWEMF